MPATTFDPYKAIREADPTKPVYGNDPIMVGSTKIVGEENDDRTVYITVKA